MATDFRQEKAVEILKDETLEQYLSNMEYFHDKLSELHHNVFFLQHIVDFPVDLFLGFEDYFLLCVARNFLQLSLLQIAKLTSDAGKDARTLRKFKNFMASAVKDEVQAEYRELLREAKWDARTENLLAVAKRLRDTTIAHSIPPNGQMDGITFDEIKKIVRELTNLFEVASFGTEYRYLIPSYDPMVQHPAGTDSRPDIERILDSIARESGVLDMPEKNPTWWPERRKRWSAEKIGQVNHYRRKFGLPEA
jgi:hypothetical protein